ncbi:MAG TPA: M20/M25/M40 family metallo-hydrolase, partial [Candidatus Binatia bacterium]|nr:M20/M25/M40 family metallo-hydrolase [Candidatus Binatia bacterium]
RLEGRTPLLFIEILGDSAETVLLYGHLDKQPPMDGWNEGLGPWKPVIRDGRLYGRGGADDGYAAFASLTAIKALKLQSVPCARCVVVIEACEESGSGDLPYYIDALKERIGTPSLVICLDSGCGNYDQLWITSSLRGLATGTLSVSTLTEGVHSGAASGIVPSTFRILRQLLSRLEDEQTGNILPRELYVEIPDERLQQVAATAQVLGATVYSEYPFQAGTVPVAREGSEALLNRTWRPQLEITGAAGLPPLDKAGNVLRPVTAAKVSLRLPPTADAKAAASLLQQLFEKDPPYGAKVIFKSEQCASGWNAPALEPWLEQSLKQASLEFFGREACYMGEGGTIPFMAMLGEKFPRAQFMITGVLGPHSNAHGPNEFLDLATGIRLTCCVTRVLVDHFKAKC